LPIDSFKDRLYEFSSANGAQYVGSANGAQCDSSANDAQYVGSANGAQYDSQGQALSEAKRVAPG
jgi:hypothetical protein